MLQLRRLTDAHVLIELAAPIIEQNVRQGRLPPGLGGHLRIVRLHMDAVCSQIPPEQAAEIRRRAQAALRAPDL